MGVIPGSFDYFRQGQQVNAADTGKYLPVHVGTNDDILFGKREPPQGAVILHGLYTEATE